VNDDAGTCPSCRADNPPGMRFCGHCGAALDRRCPRCEAAAPAEFRFCGRCGERLDVAAAAEPPADARPYTPPHLAAALLSSAAAVEGERKLVTVLFCDVAGSTALAARLGPEAMHGLLSRFFEMALAEVHRYEGTINQFLGDGFMALFGAPVAHEDHARRAVLAALGLRSRLAAQQEDLSREPGAALEVRMGVNTGLVVVGGIGDRLRMDYTAVGDTTNLAARLQQAAEPGALLISEATARLVEPHVRMRRLAPLPVKGKTEPLIAFRLLGQKQARHDRPRATRQLTPFVGRRRELALLEELWRESAAGRGQVVGIAGPPGIGKTRLLHELRVRLERQGATWLRGGCESFGRRTPYLPLEQVLRAALRLEGALPLDRLAQRVRQAIAATELPEAEALSLLLRLLATTPNGDRDTQGDRQRSFETLRQVLLAFSGQEPLVIEIEDLQWIDETSEDFLDLFVDALPQAPILLLLSYRSGYRPRWLERSCATQIPLRHLGPEESRHVLAGLWKSAAPIAGLVQQVLERSQGNPFFLEELGRSVQQGSGAAAIPETVQGVLEARIDRLPDEHKRLLQAASVLGRELPADVLDRLWHAVREAPGAQLERLLHDLTRWELLYELPGTRPARYVFEHALTQEVAYQGLLSDRRRALHAAAARAFEAVHTGDLETVYDHLAHHYPRAGEPAPAVRYLALLADRAAHRTGFGEAVEILREAAGLAERLPSDEADPILLDLAVETARWMVPLARFRDTLDLLDSHLPRIERLDDPARTARFRFWLAHTHSYLGQHADAARNARQAIAAAAEAGDAAIEGAALYVLSRDAFWAGRFVEGLEHGERAVKRLREAGETWWEGQAHWVNGFHRFVLGRPRQALAAMRLVERISTRLDDYRLDPAWSTGHFLAVLGEAQEGVEHCRRGLARARDPLNTAAALGFLGHAWLELGEPARAVEALESSTALLAESGFLPLHGWFLAFLGEAHLARGEREEARRVARQSLQVSRRGGFRLGIGLALRVLGRVDISEGRLEEAGERLAAALSVFTDIGAPLERGRVHLDLARLGSLAGRTAEAAAALAAARTSLEGTDAAAAAGYRAEIEVAERELLSRRPAGAGGEAAEGPPKERTSAT
jgi:class 3 adenylate cyclase/tetratricopeptide (TPR) repeat protein